MQKEKSKRVRPNRTNVFFSTNVLNQLKIIKKETNCKSYDEVISCFLYGLGINEDFLNMPSILTFKNFKEYVKKLKHEKAK